MDNTMDPELASEMVKLLAQELKVVRAQLREAERRTSTTPSTGGPSNRMTHEMAQALISENDFLKADNVTFQETIARLQDELTQISSMKSEEDLYNPLQHAEPMSHTSGEFAKLLAENEDLVRGKEEASRNQEKLSILQEKYRRTKAKVHEYNEILNELRVALSNCTLELEQSRKAVVPEIDFRDFLNDFPCEPVEGQLELSSTRSYTHDVRAKLHKGVTDVWYALIMERGTFLSSKGPYFINCHEVIWSPSGIALGLVVKPTFQYNPKTRTWIKREDNFDVGKQMDVCYLSGQTSRYLGTYERVGDPATMIIAPETLEYLDRKKLNYVSNGTTLFPDLLPPFQTRMITNMYKQGVIKLQCFGIRCVAFNQTFAEKLQDICTSSVQRNLPDSTVIPTSAITSGKARKRKRDAKSTVHSTKNKKRYEPSPAIS